MIDQEKPMGQNSVIPVPTGSSEGAVPPPVPQQAFAPSPPLDTTSGEFEQEVPPPASVIVPANGGTVPRWFYFVFGLTVILFLVVTGLLVLQLRQKPKETNSGIMPTVVITSVLPPIASPSVFLPGATTSAQPETLGSSDEILSIEADINSLDLLLLDKDLEAIDSQNSTD